MAPAPTPIPEPSSSALHMTQINALNKQIQELLAKNAELRRDLDTERLRGELAVSEIAKRSKEEVSDAKAVEETVRLVNKIAHLDTLWLLGEERWEVLCAASDIRKERIERTKLEFRILQFRVRERELEDRIEDLQDQLENILERSAINQDQMNDLSDQYNSSLSVVETRLVSLSAKLKTTRIERDSVATQLSTLKSSNSSLQESLDDSKKETESLQRNIERLKLELEGKNRDVKEMREQVKGWRRLEGKGNEEIETERAKRVELEVGLKVEKDRVKEGKKRVKELLAEFDATQTELKEAQVEIESLRAESEKKAKKESIKAKKALVQGQDDPDEQQAATKRKRVAEDVLDAPVTKKVKKRPSLLPPNSDDEHDAPSGHEHEPSPPPTPKLKKSRAKKPVKPTTYDVPLMQMKNGKSANSQPQRPPERDEGEEPDVQVTLPKPVQKKKPPASRKEKATQPKEEASTATAPSQEKKPKTLAEHAGAVAPTKPTKKVNLGSGRGLLGVFGGLGGIDASNINWGGEMGGSNVYGIPLTLSSPVKGGRDEASQGSMFTFGANR